MKTGVMQTDVTDAWKRNGIMETLCFPSIGKRRNTVHQKVYRPQFRLYSQDNVFV